MKTLNYFLLAIFAFLLSINTGWAAAIDINTADAEQIASVMKGVGTNKAEAIVLYRQQHGPFRSVDDLSLVRGIGKKTIEINRDVIMVGKSPQDDRKKTKER